MFVWTGDEVLLWGEGLRGVESNVGVALDPMTGEWRPLPAAPFGLNQGDAVWDGREMVIVGSHLDITNLADGPSGSVAIAYAPRRTPGGNWRTRSSRRKRRARRGRARR